MHFTVPKLVWHVCKALPEYAVAKSHHQLLWLAGEPAAELAHTTPQLILVLLAVELPATISSKQPGQRSAEHYLTHPQQAGKSECAAMMMLGGNSNECMHKI